MNKDKFLSLLMGNCWHEWEEDEGQGFYMRYICRVCLKTEVILYRGKVNVPVNPDHLSNPLPVIRFMEKEMPETLDDYIGQCILQNQNESRGSVTVFFILNLSNLITYLSEHREWGEKKCEACDSCEYPYDTCNGNNIMCKYPALVYMEECEEGKDVLARSL